MALKIVPIFIAQRFYFHFWTAEIAAFWPLKAEVNALSAVAWFTFQTFALPTKARLHSQRRGNTKYDDRLLEQAMAVNCFGISGSLGSFLFGKNWQLFQ